MTEHDDSEEALDDRTGYQNLGRLDDEVSFGEKLQLWQCPLCQGLFAGTWRDPFSFLGDRATAVVGILLWQPTLSANRSINERRRRLVAATEAGGNCTCDLTWQQFKPCHDDLTTRLPETVEEARLLGWTGYIDDSDEDDPDGWDPDEEEDE